MVHRLHNRNSGYGNNLTSTMISNQATLSATEGATALNINTEDNKVIEKNNETEETKSFNNETSLENISM